MKIHSISTLEFEPIDLSQIKGGLYNISLTGGGCAGSNGNCGENCGCGGSNGNCSGGSGCGGENGNCGGGGGCVGSNGNCAIISPDDKG